MNDYSVLLGLICSSGAVDGWRTVPDLHDCMGWSGSKPPVDSPDKLR